MEALKSLSFSLEPGKAVALLGPNGAGKSTAIELMVTLIQPDAGQFLWEGQNLFGKPGAIRDLLGYVSQELAMDKQLTGAEFMRVCAGVNHLPGGPPVLGPTNSWRKWGFQTRKINWWVSIPAA